MGKNKPNIVKFPVFDDWYRKFRGSLHPKLVKDVMQMTYAALYSAIIDGTTGAKELQKDISDYFNMSKLAGETQSYRLLPGPTQVRGSARKRTKFQKQASALSKMVAGLDPAKAVLNIIQEAIDLGEGPPTDRLQARYKSYNKAKAVARTAMLNYYTLNYLTQWQKNGLELVKRVEMHDHKTCPICRPLNGSIHSIDDLLIEDYPLTFLTHNNCRGSYAPYMAMLSRVRPQVPILKTISLRGNKATGTPPEFAPWVRHVFLKDRFPFDVKFTFDKTAPMAKLDRSTLVIGVFNIGDRDVREVILEQKAKMLWPLWKTRFMKEYMPMIQRGLVHPVRHADTPEAIFIDGYIALRLKQLDEGFEIYWWGQNFGVR